MRLAVLKTEKGDLIVSPDSIYILATEEEIKCTVLGVSPKQDYVLTDTIEQILVEIQQAAIAVYGLV